jgi:hypothetical protein
MNPQDRALYFESARQVSLRRGRMETNGQDWNVYLEPGNIYEDRETRQPLLTVRLQLNWQNYFCSGEFPDRMLVTLRDMIGRYLELPQQPVRVEVMLQEPKRRRRRARAQPAGDVDNEKEAIKRRMLEGR